MHEADPELVSESKILPKELEQEIKEGFYELKQKFKYSEGPSQNSIYISHVVLHQKHPVFSKLSMDVLRNLL